MRRWVTVLGCIAMQVCVLLVFGPTPARATRDDVRARDALAGLRMPIIANQGQTDARVAFYAPTFAGTLFVTRQGELVYSLPDGVAGGPRGKRERLPRGGWALSERLAGGRVRPVGQEPSATGVSYFLGNDPARWRPKVATYEGVGLGEVWPGVTVSLHTRGRSIEKIFTVQPGAPVDRIRVRVGGATGLAVNADGALVARTGLGPVTFTAPLAYQEHAGVRHPVAVAYRLEGREYGFTIGTYDPSMPLVIDPILQSTYLGGSNSDAGDTFAIHPATGDVYVAGSTLSTNFPHTLGGPQPTHGGGSYDGYVARLNGSLTSFIQSTYLGGTLTDYVNALAIHPTNGDIYAVGFTQSANFPGTGGGAQPLFGGSADAFVARLSPSLTSLVQATYLGGTGFEQGYGTAIHPTTGDVYVTGYTDSTNFPKTAGGAQTTPGGQSDAYIARLNSALTSHIQSTYLGGNDTDIGDGLAIHPTTGDVYLTGYTDSNNFPGTGGGAQPTFGGAQDSYVARLTSSLTSLTQATYLGGSNYDFSGSVAIHPMTGDVYVVGGTQSTNFPGTAGGAQPASGGGDNDGFVVRLPSSLNSLTQATYLGGSGADLAFGIAIHPVTGEIYLSGRTSSTNFPRTIGAAQPTSGGGGDAFVARLTASLTSIVQATYLGGSSDDNSLAVAFHPSTTDAFVVGRTSSSNFPAVAGGGQSTYGGAGDAFVTRLTYSLAAEDGLGLSALVNQPTFTVGQTVKASIGAINPGLPGIADIYLGAARPDGLIEFVTNNGIVVDTVNNLHPILTAVSLATPIAVPAPNVYTHQFTANDPRGSYTFFFAAIRAGTVIGLALAPYSFP